MPTFDLLWVFFLFCFFFQIPVSFCNIFLTFSALRSVVFKFDSLLVCRVQSCSPHCRGVIDGMDGCWHAMLDIAPSDDMLDKLVCSMLDSVCVCVCVCIWLHLVSVFTADNDRQMEVNCNSISGNVTVAPDQGTHHGPRTTNNCYLMFHGVGLTQEGLKDWLRHCAKQVNSHRLDQVESAAFFQIFCPNFVWGQTIKCLLRATTLVAL